MIGERTTKSDLPENWVELSFTRVFSIKGGGQPPKSVFINEDREGYIRLLQIRDFGNRPVPTYVPFTTKLQICKKNDLLIARYGASIGRILSGMEGAYNVAMAKVIIPDSIDTNFVYYLLKSHLFQYPILSIQRTAQNGFNKKDLERIAIPLPPPPEQIRLVAKLDLLFGQLDRLKARLARVPDLLADFRRAVLGKAVTGELTSEWAKITAYTPVDETLSKTTAPDRPNRFRSRSTTITPGQMAISVNTPKNKTIPKRYRWTLLCDIASLSSGHTPSRKHPEYWGGEINWLGIKDANSNHASTIYETQQKTNALGLENSASVLLPADTICLSRTASVGYVVKMGVPMATSQDFVNWTCTEAINPDWLKWLLIAEKDSITSFGRGSTHTTVYFPEVLSLTVALPPIEEQQEIVSRIESLFAHADRIQARYESLLIRVEDLPRAILAKAFRGELTEQLPEDGDARDLLAELEME